MRTRIHDYARVNTSSRVTGKQTVLAALDAFIGGFILMLVVGMIIAVLYLIAG